jgi:tetratricopeptide (TPR) repeat protein
MPVKSATPVAAVYDRRSAARSASAGIDRRYSSDGSPIVSWSKARILTVSVALFALTGCEMAPVHPPIQYTGDPIVDGNAELAAAPAKDRVLWNYRLAATALRLGRFDETQHQLDDALPLIGGILANSADAKKARSLFSAESTKTFIGEPYERVMAYYYRAVLYWRDGQPDNARACYRSGQLIDSDAEADAYKSDYVLLDYLDGLASAKLGADGSDAFARAGENYHRELPAYDLQANVLVFAEYGRGPCKYAGGEYGEQLRFMVEDSPAHSAKLTVEGRAVALPPYDDLNFQATTRGGRVMDYILGHKAVFKKTTDTVGNVALAGAAIAANNIYKRDGTKSDNAQNTAIALGLIGVGSKIFSAATTPQADTRTWDNLPQRLSFAALRLPPGEHPAILEFFNSEGKRIERLTRQLTLSVLPEGDSVIFLSELKR